MLRRGIFVAIFCVWITATHRRLPVWQSEQTLWADAAAKTPNKPRPVMDYGRALELIGDGIGAERQYRRTISLTLDPRRGEKANRFALAAAETNIAHLYLRTGREASAMVVLKRTLDWWPEFPYAHYNIGRVLWRHGACADAMEEITYARNQVPFLSLPNEPCGQQ